jgi:hypothetical protein
VIRQNPSLADTVTESGSSKSPAMYAVRQLLHTAGNQAANSMVQNSPAGGAVTAQRPFASGLPDAIKKKMESIGRVPLDDIRVHYNSDKPAEVKAYAYTQGNDIHIAPGQEKYLPHETWHAVQQKQGRVKPVNLLGGISSNDDAGLESEADKAGTYPAGQSVRPAAVHFSAKSHPSSRIVQRARIRTSFGKVTASRGWQGQPSIKTRARDYKKVKLGTKYPEIIAVFSGLSADEQQEAARNLLTGRKFDNPSLDRAAAMLTGIVYIAEDFRGKGAAKIYRALLRQIISGKIRFGDFIPNFKFALKAKAGRKQITRIKQHEEKMDEMSDGEVDSTAPRSFPVIQDGPYVL